MARRSWYIQEIGKVISRFGARSGAQFADSCEPVGKLSGFFDIRGVLG